VLRPGIVHGPRARWTAGFADDLLAGRAYLVGDGDGICNAIYVDNLVHAIHLASTADAAAVDREAFLVGDAERVTWADLYAPIARALGMELADVPRVGFEEGAAPRADWWQRLNVVKETRPARALLDRFPERLRFVVYSGLGAWRSFRPASAANPAARAGSAGANPAPVATREMALLHGCRYKLPSTKAERALGYRPPVSFADACRRSIGWLAFAGYPVIEPETIPCGTLAAASVEER
jgi:nucleoside-diphosphate-sugar epimerase